MVKLLRILVLCLITNSVYALPAGFVYLHDVDPSIVQDMRYAGTHNFVGRPIKGYEKHSCILTKETAEALSQIQKDLQQSSLSLKVYDCYRPTMAVGDVIAWNKNSHHEMKDEFYPNVSKDDLVRLNYIAETSSHSRGSTVDVTIIPVPYLPQAQFRPGQKLVSCIAPYLKRFRDNSLDMGTGYNCMDELSHPENKEVSLIAYHQRMLLRDVMMKYNFNLNEEKWWHFTLKNEPFPNTYFNFPVR